MDTTKSEVKRYVISEYGREEAISERQYLVEISAGADPDSLDGERLSEAADEVGVGWEMPELDGPYHEGYDVEGLADEVECDGLPVVRLDVANEGRDNEDDEQESDNGLNVGDRL